jgi:hypothetical protein
MNYFKYSGDQNDNTRVIGVALKTMILSLRYNYSGLFTSRGCCSGEAVACETVLCYCEQATMKPMR